MLSHKRLHSTQIKMVTDLVMLHQASNQMLARQPRVFPPKIALAVQMMTAMVGQTKQTCSRSTLHNTSTKTWTALVIQSMGSNPTVALQFREIRTKEGLDAWTVMEMAGLTKPIHFQPIPWLGRIQTATHSLTNWMQSEPMLAQRCLVPQPTIVLDALTQTLTAGLTPQMRIPTIR